MSPAENLILAGGDGPRRNRPRRWRTRGALPIAIGALAALAGGALWVAFVGPDLGGTHTSVHKRAYLARLVPEVASPPGPQALSTLGLPLGTPALALRGVDDPDDRVKAVFPHAPRAGILFNLDSGAVLWKLHPTERVPIASLTKMMTALMVVQSTPPNARVLITKEAEHMPGSRVGLLPLGHEVQAEPLMYGLLLPSGNDAAVALAEHVAGTVRHFVQEMNEETAVLGLGCTQYSNPSGYIDHGNFSCAADLAVLAHDDLDQPRLARVMRTPSAVLRFPIKGGKLFLYNNNPILIYGYPGANGVKTGYTLAAGKCLVATAERRGVRLGVVLLNAPQPGVEAQQLLNEGFEQIYHVPRMREPPIPGGV
jgi:D-alanyl-D-alanine carboxypeptidase